MTAMDYVLRIADSAGTVTLTTSPLAIKEYQPRVGGVDDEIVAESILIRAADGSPTANLDEFRAIDRMLVQARRGTENRNLPRVYLEFGQSGTTSMWRSEITNGRVELDAGALTYPYWTGDTQFSTVYIERKNWWDGAEVQIPLTNLNGTADTSGLAVYNCNDLSGTAPAIFTNYVDIAGTAVLGDTPGATRLEMTSITAYTQRVWIGQSCTNPTTVNHWFEAEDATGASGTASALNSGGEYATAAMSTANETTLFTWALSAADVSAYAGNWFRALIRFHLTVGVSDTLFRLKVLWGDNTVWQSGQGYAAPTEATNIRELFTVQLPPWLQGVASQDELSLVLTGQQATGSTVTLSIDYLSLMPVEGWRRLDTVGSSVPADNVIIDDGINDATYHSASDKTAKAGNMRGYGERIHLHPSKAQRLYFLTHGDGFGGAGNIERKLTIKLYHRPRRRVL
jgi:hypothetical protein